MRLREAVPLAVLLIAVAVVVGTVLRLLERDRANVLEQLQAERMSQLDEAARRFSDDLDDLGEDLRFAAGLLRGNLDPQAHERELRALIEVVGQYKAIAVVGPPGEPPFAVWDRRVSGDVKGPAAIEALRQAAAEARTRPVGAITTTPLISLGAGEHRVFATAVDEPAGGGTAAVVAVLADVAPLLTPFALIASASDTRLLLLGAAGRPVHGSDPAIATYLREGRQQLRTFDAAVLRMRESARGCSLLPEDEAAALGLGADPAVMCSVPIMVEGGRAWAAGTIVSTRSITSPTRRAAVRTLLGAAGILAFLGLFAGYVVVASRRAAALRATRAEASRLAVLHDRTQKVLDHIPSGVVVLDAAGRVSAVNATVRDRSGAVETGASLATLLRADGAAAEALEALVSRAAVADRAQSLFGERLRLWGQDGQFNVHAVPLESGDPTMQSLLVLEDISKVSALETQLVRAEKLATIGVLAAGIAHEIGTPLGVIRGRAEYLLDRIGASSSHAAGLRTIAEQSDQVAATIRQLLDFSRVHAPLTRSVPLGSVAAAVAELLTLEAQRRGLTLSVEVDPQLPAVLADEDGLRQVLVNLVLNAFDASTAGGTVVIGGRSPAPGFVELTVSDVGCGIPAEHQSQVFDPFFSTKKRGQGTGLGLTIVSQIVRNHGATLQLESREGMGTTVRVSWPAAGPQEAHRVEV